MDSLIFVSKAPESNPPIPCRTGTENRSARFTNRRGCGTITETPLRAAAFCRGAGGVRILQKRVVVMYRVTVPEGYAPSLGLYETQKAIGLIKNVFLVKICAALHLKRVTAPLFVDPATGLNDDLNGVERPVSFDIPAAALNAQVVHSLAKWKRLALHNYGFFVGNGLVADMNAIRRDEELDNLHSIYVDQWDWEKVIDREMRTTEFLEDTVRRIVSAICGTLDELKWQFSGLSTELCRDVFFITAQELEDRYPDLTRAPHRVH